MPVRVLLLRDDDKAWTAQSALSPLPRDRYAQEFTQRGWESTTVPVLAPSWLHADTLYQTLQAGPGSRYWGLVLTSARAVEAICACLKVKQTTLLAQWYDTPLFVVGENTARAAQSLFGANQIVQGQNTGNAVQLADHIGQYIRNYNSTNCETHNPVQACGQRLPPPLPVVTEQCHTMLRSHSHLDHLAPSLLFFSSAIRRPTLVNRLSDQGVAVTELPVYTIQPRATVQADLEAALTRSDQSAIKTTHPPYDWVVFFSPSGVDAALPTIANYQCREWFKNLRVAAIGPTTAQHLQDRYGISPQVIASCPTAPQLVEEMAQVERAETTT
ncbi:uroporphyrinogen-III synthase [Dimargaris verticillata]|uniref:Uroporphyrinogen-III synthase n=1 Tax=Dimargaris verticillata TaxID=2761393 RepID=A0A9W8B4X3_9FUNG|nr:uroporphyrinogen-III synthase [Dimargaris verticillata]